MFKLENDFYRIMAIIFLLVTILILGVVLICHFTDCKYIEAGYTKKTLVGYDYPRWTKE